MILSLSYVVGYLRQIRSKYKFSLKSVDRVVIGPKSTSYRLYAESYYGDDMVFAKARL